MFLSFSIASKYASLYFLIVLLRSIRL